MSVLLKIEMIIVSLITFVVIIKMLKSKKMSIRYSVMWILLPLFFLVFVLFSGSIVKIANYLGFEVLSNFVFFIIIGLLLIICFSLTAIVTHLNQKVTELVQEVAILKKGNK